MPRSFCDIEATLIEVTYCVDSSGGDLASLPRKNMVADLNLCPLLQI